MSGAEFRARLKPACLHVKRARHFTSRYADVDDPFPGYGLEVYKPTRWLGLGARMQ